MGIACKLKLYIMAHLWELCLPGNKYEAKIPLFSSQETSWPGLPLNDRRKEEIYTSPLETDWNQEMLDFAPSPFTIKQAWILTQARWFFGTQVHYLLGLPSFQIKFLFLAQTLISCFIGLSCNEQYDFKLGNMVKGHCHNSYDKWSSLLETVKMLGSGHSVNILKV